jgi:hypothetical protein
LGTTNEPGLFIGKGLWNCLISLGFLADETAETFIL